MHRCSNHLSEAKSSQPTPQIKSSSPTETAWYSQLTLLKRQSRVRHLEGQKKQFKRAIRPMDLFSASDKAIYDRRKQMIAERRADGQNMKKIITPYIYHLSAVSCPSSIIHISVKKSRACFWLIYTKNWINCPNPVRKICVLRYETLQTETICLSHTSKLLSAKWWNISR